MAQFERTVVANDAPFDRFMARWNFSSQKPPLIKGLVSRSLLALSFLQVRLSASTVIMVRTLQTTSFYNVGFPNPNLDVGRAEGSWLCKEISINVTLATTPRSHGSRKQKPVKKNFLRNDNIENLGAFRRRV